MSITLRICLIFLIVSALGFYFFARQEIGDTTKRYREATEEPLVDFAVVLANMVAAESETPQITPSSPWNSCLGADCPRLLPNVDSLRLALKYSSAQVLSAQIYNLLKTNVDTRIYVTDDRGVVVYDSDSGRDEGKDYSRWNDVRQTLRGDYGARTSRDHPGAEGSVLYVAAPVKLNGRIIGSLTVAKPNENANRFIDVAKRSTLVLGFVSFFTVAGLAVILLLIVSRPIKALTDYARAVRDGKRVALPSLPSGELRILAGAFEEMREALEGRKYVEQYVQTLTHEIKSPLTAIRGAVEILREDPPAEIRQQFMKNIERETERAQDLVNKLLSLSALQRKNSLDRAETVSLTEMTGRVLAAEQANAEVKGLQFKLDSTGDVSVQGDVFWLEEALGNVVQNAIDFAPEKSVIEIELRIEGGVAKVFVRDRGPGVPEWALGKIFDQFYSLPRPDSGKRSSGLGLTIVREVAELHGGSALLENHSDGGALVTLTLPLLAARA